MCLMKCSKEESDHFNNAGIISESGSRPFVPRQVFIGFSDALRTVQLGVLIFLNGAMENSVYSRRFVFVFISKQMRANQPWTLTEN